MGYLHGGTQLGHRLHGPIGRLIGTQPGGFHAHGLGNILHALDAGHLVPGHDMRKQQGIADAVGDIEPPAQRIGQRMHRADSGITERHTGHQAGGGHVFAGLQIGRIGVGLGQRFGDEFYRADGQ